MGAIKKHKRTLANGKQRTYVYKVNGDKRRSLLHFDGSCSGSVSPKPYREKEKNRIVAILQANSSVLVIGEPGSGKSFLKDLVANELKDAGFPVVVAQSSTTKRALVSIAKQLDLDTKSLEGKTLKVEDLQEEIALFLTKNIAFLIFDNAHRLQPSIRYWLEELHAQGQPMLLFATYPPARDIFLRLPRIELKPLKDRWIREIMKEAAAEQKIELTDAQLADLQQRCGGNPMLAKRVISEEHAGLDDTNPDHTQWIDLTPFFIAGLMLLIIIRFIGLGFNSTSLYLIGGILTVSVGIVRFIIYNLPRQSQRLGR